MAYLLLSTLIDHISKVITIIIQLFRYIISALTYLLNRFTRNLELYVCLWVGRVKEQESAIYSKLCDMNIRNRRTRCNPYEVYDQAGWDGGVQQACSLTPSRTETNESAVYVVLPESWTPSSTAPAGVHWSDGEVRKGEAKGVGGRVVLQRLCWNLRRTTGNCISYRIDLEYRNWFSFINSLYYDLRVVYETISDKDYYHVVL